MPPEAAALVAALTRAGVTVAVAESLTAGQVCAALADVPGASAVLRGGVVAYATDVKASVLGVDAALLAAQGPVHPGVAAQMARGVRRLLGADIGLATTGVAGPDPQGGRPVGTVFVAANRATSRHSPHHEVDVEGSSRVRPLLLPGDRARIRAASTAAALDLLAEVLGVGEGSGAPGAR